MAKHRQQRKRHGTNIESRGVEVVTVVWMMSVVTTVLCGGVAAVVLLIVRPETDSPQLFGRLLHFGAFVSAILSLVLLGIVLKVREEPPPPAVSWFAAIAAVVVIATAFLY